MGQRMSSDAAWITGVVIAAVAAVGVGGYLVLPKPTQPLAVAPVASSTSPPTNPIAEPAATPGPVTSTAVATPAEKEYPALDPWGRPVTVVRSGESSGSGFLSGLLSAVVHADHSTGPTTRPADGPEVVVIDGPSPGVSPFGIPGPPATQPTDPAADPGGATDHVGPRGGVYHYSDSGKKVYTGSGHGRR